MHLFATLYSVLPLLKEGLQPFFSKGGYKLSRYFIAVELMILKLEIGILNS